MDGFLVMQVISLDTTAVAMVPLVGQMLFFFSCMVITFERIFFIKV